MRAYTIFISVHTGEGARALAVRTHTHVTHNMRERCSRAAIAAASAFHTHTGVVGH